MSLIHFLSLLFYFVFKFRINIEQEIMINENLEGRGYWRVRKIRFRF
jgi:hypothetical protein